MSTPSTLKTTKPEEKLFQHYSCARQSMRMLTDTGKKITFVNFQFITDDKQIIEYLNEQIDMGLPNVTKGKLMSAEDADPMRALKKRMMEEAREELRQEAINAAKGIVPPGSSTADKQGNTLQPLGAAGTDKLPTAGTSNTGGDSK